MCVLCAWLYDVRQTAADPSVAAPLMRATFISGVAGLYVHGCHMLPVCYLNIFFIFIFFTEAEPVVLIEA